MEIAWFQLFQCELMSKLKTAAVILKYLVKVFSLIRPGSSVLWTTVWSSITNTLCRTLCSLFWYFSLFDLIFTGKGLHESKCLMLFCSDIPWHYHPVSSGWAGSRTGNICTNITAHIRMPTHREKIEASLLFWSHVLAYPRYAIIQYIQKLVFILLFIKLLIAK